MTVCVLYSVHLLWPLMHVTGQVMPGVQLAAFPRKSRANDFFSRTKMIIAAKFDTIGAFGAAWITVGPHRDDIRIRSFAPPHTPQAQCTRLRVRHPHPREPSSCQLCVQRVDGSLSQTFFLQAPRGLRVLHGPRAREPRSNQSKRLCILSHCGRFVDLHFTC